MMHNRKLVIGAVALVRAKLRGDTEILSRVRDDVEELLVQSNFFEGAPFAWVGLIIRYGLQHRSKPQYQRINEMHGDLPIAIELDMHILRTMSTDELAKAFTVATLEALIDVAERFGRPAAALLARLDALATPPSQR